MLKVGIVGLPNAGKSTLFNALVRGHLAPAENFPFCTIEPNVGMVEVPDSRLNALAALVQPRQIVPAVIQFIDIAGLVEGAHKGEGLGNKFLSHIKETDLIVLVLRAFSDANVSHVYGDIDAVRDYETLMLELVMSDLMVATAALDRAERASHDGKQETAERAALIKEIVAVLEHNWPLSDSGLPAREDAQALLRELALLTAKPRLLVINIDEPDVAAPTTNRSLAGLLTRGRRVSSDFAAPNVLFVSGRLEAELLNVPPAEQAEWLKSYGLTEPSLHRLIRAAYERLRLQSFFTAGPKEVRAWTVPRGATARTAAGVIHTDFYDRFIRAEVIKYDDFILFGGEAGAREAGRLRSEGRQYPVQDGDILHIRFSP